MLCPVCASPEVSRVKTFKQEGLFSNNGIVELCSCAECQLQYNPYASTINQDQLRNYYQGKSDWENRKAELLTSLGGYESTFKCYSKFASDAISKNGFKQLNTIRGIDIGGGAGEFCFFAKRNNIPTDLMDFSHQRLRFANEILDIPNTFISLPEIKYDMIWLLQVIEHIASPQSYLKEVIDKCAKPGTLIMIATPNTSSLGAKFFRSEWRHYNPHHISLFNPKSIKTLINSMGLKLIALDNQRMYSSGTTSSIRSLIGTIKHRKARSLPTDGLCALVQVPS